MTITYGARTVTYKAGVFIIGARSIIHGAAALFCGAGTFSIGPVVVNTAALSSPTPLINPVATALFLHGDMLINDQSRTANSHLFLPRHIRSAPIKGRVTLANSEPGESTRNDNKNIKCMSYLSTPGSCQWCVFSREGRVFYHKVFFRVYFKGRRQNSHLQTTYKPQKVLCEVTYFSPNQHM